MCYAAWVASMRYDHSVATCKGIAMLASNYRWHFASYSIEFQQFRSASCKSNCFEEVLCKALVAYDLIAKKPM